MRSPFPGMDPFLEGVEWEDFHTRFNTAISEYLAARVEPRYFVRIERRSLRRAHDGRTGRRCAGPTWRCSWRKKRRSPGAAPFPARRMPSAPVECLLPTPEEQREIVPGDPPAETRVRW
jgi:hypothetical protein